MRPVKFLYLYITYCFLHTHKVKNLFLFPKVGTYQIKRCTYKNNIKSQICISYSAPCQISLSLHQNLCFTYAHSFQFFLLSKVPMKEIGALYKSNIHKITYFHFWQCALSNFFIFTSHIVFYILTKLKICFFIQRYLTNNKVHLQT